MKRGDRGVVGRALTMLGALVLVGGCHKPVEDAPQTCQGEQPLCYQPTSDGCCAEQPVPAVCGPKDAPVGTHLKWICADPTVTRSECRGLGAACQPKGPDRPEEVRAPHAAVQLQVFDPDAATDVLGDGGAREAGAPPKGKRGKKHR